MEGKRYLSVGLTLLIAGAMLVAMPLSPNSANLEVATDVPASVPMASTIYVGEYVFDFNMGEPRMDPALMAADPSPGEMGNYIVHMTGPIPQQWADGIGALGGEVLTYVHNFAYQVRMTPEMASAAERLPFVDWIGDYHPAYKMSPALTDNSASVSLYGESIPASALEQVRSEMNVIEESATGWGYVVRGEALTSASLGNIAANPYVQYVSPIYEKELHDEAGMQVMGGGLWQGDNDANHATPYRVSGSFGSKFNQVTGASGSGITIGVADTGLGNGNIGNAGHVDFENRVIGGYSYDGADFADGHGHGTHCAGLAAANGYAGTGTTYAGFGPYYAGMGLAYDANLYSVKIFSDAGSFIGPTDDGDILVRSYSGGARVSSNSWGAPTGGDYIDSDSNYDMRVRDASTAGGNQQLSVFVSAGNSGSGANTIGSPGNAKNVVTVGGVENYMPDASSYGNTYSTVADNPDVMYTSSSRGWTDDGRIKPDIVTPGVNTLSTHSPCAGSNLFGLYTGDNRYEWCTGTSQSCPTAAGGGAAVNEWYIDTQGATPTPAMTKALLINTAKDIGTADIPNANEGWGRMMLNTISDHPDYFYFQDAPAELTTGAYHEYKVSYIDNTQPFKVTLVWTDRYAADGAAVALINDLRLQVFAPLGQEYRGNAFSAGYTPQATNPSATFDTNSDGNDDRNTVECVYIPTTGLQTGLYTIRISGFNVPGDCDNDGANDQDYALVVYNAVDVTSQGTIDIELPRYPRESTVAIEVKDGDLNTNTAVQTVSVNLRSNGEPVGESVTLTETGGDTGVFQGTCAISATNSAGVVYVLASDTITATYNDADDGSGSPAVVTDTAVVDSTVAAPTGLTVQWYGVSTSTLINEGFSSGVPPTGWGELDPTADWGSSATATAGGTSPEARFTWYNGIDIWRLYSGPIDTTGMTTLDLQFRQMFDDYASGVRVKVQTSSDGTTWHDTTWYIDSGSGNVGPGLVSLSLTTDVGSPTFRIGFTVDGNAYQLDNWYVDDVLLTYTGGGLTDDNKLDWTLSSDDGGGADDVDHYNIYRSSSSSGPWTTVYDTVPAGTATYIDPNAGEFDGTNWWYVVRAVDTVGNVDTNTNAVPEQAVGGATSTATGPTGGPTNVAGITLAYSYTGSPTSVNLYYTTNGGTSWTLAGNDASVNGAYAWTVPAPGTYGWLASAVGDGSTEPSPPSGGTAPESSSYIFDNVAPSITATTFADGATGVATTAGTYDADFSESMAAVGSVTTNLPTPSYSWVDANTYRITYGTLAYATTYTTTYQTTFTDVAGNALGGDRVKTFTTQAAPAATAAATGPTGGPTTVTAITITYTFTGTPTSVNIYYTTNGGTTWVLAGNDATVDGSFSFTLPGSGDYQFLVSAVGGGSTEPSPPPGGTLPEIGVYIVDLTPPAAPTGLTVEHFGPGSGTVAVEASQVSGSAVASASLVLDAPAGITAGELLLLIAMNEDDTSTAQFSNNLAGWNFIGTSGSATPDAHIGAFWRIADGTEGASVTVTAQSSDQWMGWYIRISGADTITPIDVSNFATGGALATHTVPSVTTTVDNCLAIYGLSFDGGDGDPFSVAAPWTEGGDGGYGTANPGVAGTWGTQTVASAGATGNAVVTATVADGAAYFQLAIRPGSSGGTLDDNTLNWTHSGADVDHYNIYRADNMAGPYSVIDTVPVGTNTYCDVGRGQADATIWWYRVRAVDAVGNEETNTNSVPEPSLLPYSIDLTGKAANSWVLVSFPSSLNGNIQDILNDAAAGDGGTTWSIAKWYNPTDPADPWKTYRVGGTANDMPAVSNWMGFWLYLTANGGDQQLTLSSYAEIPAVTSINLSVTWNLVGYPSMAPTTGVTLPAEADMMSVYSGSAAYTDYIGAGLDSVPITHGNAYFIHVTADCLWWVTNP